MSPYYHPQYHPRFVIFKAYATLCGMNARPDTCPSQKGNAFLYILIAVVLLAGLTFTISRIESQDSGGQAKVDRAQVELDANAILSYASSVQNAIIRMDQVGVSADQLDFMQPWETTFNDPPTTEKLFHPDGGGLNYKPLPPTAVGISVADPAPRFYVGRFNNFDWTPTTEMDVIFTAYKITRPVCEELNRRVIGDPAIGTYTSTMARVLVEGAGKYHSGGFRDMQVAQCAACEDKPSFCITDGTSYAFYSIMDAK